MARNRKAVEAADLIASSNSDLIFFHGPHGCGLAFSDPAVGGTVLTEFFLELDKPTQTKMMAAKLETNAAVHKALGEGISKVAATLKTGG
jgi:hypothetical protein